MIKARPQRYFACSPCGRVTNPRWTLNGKGLLLLPRNVQRLSSERFKLLRAAHLAQCVLCHPPLKDPHCSLLVDHSPPVVWSESHIIGQQMEISACDPLSRARNGVPPAPRCAMLIINHGCPQTKILLSWNTMEHKGHHCQGSLRAWRGAVVQGLIGCSGPGVVHGFLPTPHICRIP